MPRVDPADVTALVATSLSDTQVEAFLIDASAWVDNYLVGACSALAADKLPIIEKYIAAHLVAVASPGATGTLVGATRQDISEKYAQPGDKQQSRYIGVAAAFDPCGIVEEFWIGARPKFRARVGTGYAQ